MKSKWLRHPEYPDWKILVYRSWLGWFLKNPHVAYEDEVAFYLEWCAALRVDPYAQF